MTEPLPPTTTELKWEQLALELEFSALSDVRATAEKWRAGLVGLTALIGTATTLGGPFSVAKLQPSARWTVAVCLGVAVLILAIASLSAMRAAFGSPTNILNNGARLRDWSMAEARRSATYLRLASILTFVALLLLALSAVLGYGATANDDYNHPTVVHQPISIVDQSSTGACSENCVTDPCIRGK